MNDFETLKEMLTRTNIPYTVDGPGRIVHQSFFVLSTAHVIDVYNGPLIPMPTARHPDNMVSTIGYSNFLSTWLFDNDGKLLAIGHYDE